MRTAKGKIVAALSIFTALILTGAALIAGRLSYIDNHFGLEQWRESLSDALGDGLHIPYYYVNNDKRYVVSDAEFEEHDVKELVKKDGMLRMINHPRGYRMDFPTGTKFDFSASNEFIEAENRDYSFVLSKEYSPYENTREYIKEYLNKYLLDERFTEQNKIEIHKNAVERVGHYWIQVVFATRTPAPMCENKRNTYAYCYIYEKDRIYYRLMVKSEEYNRDFTDTVYKMLYSFNPTVPIQGEMKNSTHYKSVPDPDWNDETRAFYDELVSSDKLKWGIYIPQGVRDMKFDKLDEIENKIDYKFDGMIEYSYYFYDFPLKGMEAAYERGKIVELTVQCSTVMNQDLNGWSPALDLADGALDDTIRSLARGAKKFGHPFLMRLNNEMNSDWVSYCSSVMMLDPSLYRDLWRRYYRIFKEEGVDNAIWVFNPNDNTFPPCGYNDPKAYYPGNGYVHVFGVTGYNTGTYYAEKYGEKWREFEDLYDEAYELFAVEFGGFPWIITEFASSSVGGDKVQWINNMFDVLPKYQNIKMAFWFNHDDYDPDYPDSSVVSRPYRLDETEATLKAFGDRVKE